MSTTDFVVKTVFQTDVRRFKLPRISLVLLRDLISKTYDKLPTGFLVKYTDPEGDLCSIGSDAELEEAFNISGSTLKLEILAIEDARGASASPEVENIGDYEDLGEPKADKEVVIKEEREVEPIKEEKKGEETVKSEEKDEKGEKPTSEGKGEEQEQICELLFGMVQDPEIQAKFPLIFQSVVGTIEKGNMGVKTILDDLFVAVPSLKDTAFSKIVPTLLKHEEKINAALEDAKHFIPMILPMLKDVPLLLPQILASVDFNHLKEQIKLLLGGAFGDFRRCPFGDFYRCQEFQAKSGDCQAQERSCGESEADDNVHSNIKCDGCGEFPISGDRYKCTVCPDYDLCSTCEKKNLHPASHALLKLKRPVRRDIHYGVSCDGCGMKPIEGIRYKCLTCPNFDLCSSCEEKNQHPSDHSLLKLKVRSENSGPCRRRFFGGPFRGPFGPFGFARGPHHFFRHGHGPHHGDGPHHGPHHGHGHHHGHGPFKFVKKLLKSVGIFPGGFGEACRSGGQSPRKMEKCQRKMEKCQRKMEKCQDGQSPRKMEKCQRKMEKCQRKMEKCQEKCQRKMEKCQRKWDKQCHGKAAPLTSKFVQDVNLPDGSVVASGSGILEKKWLLKNTGSVQWPEGSKLIFLRGNRELLGEREEYLVPLAEPGQSVEVSCPIIVPEKAGRYSAYFQLADKDRSVFGHRFWIEIVVKGEEKQVQVEGKKPVQSAPAEEDKAKVVQGLSSTVPAEPKYASALSVLEKMGFVNEKLNLSLLARSQGNMEQVVSWLLEMENSMSH